MILSAVYAWKPDLPAPVNDCCAPCLVHGCGCGSNDDDNKNMKMINNNNNNNKEIDDTNNNSRMQCGCGEGNQSCRPGCYQQMSANPYEYVRHSQPDGARCGRLNYGIDSDLSMTYLSYICPFTIYTLSIYIHVYF